MQANDEEQPKLRFNGKRIADIREIGGEKQRELAKAIHVSRETLSKWEVNIGEPKATDIIRIARHYGISTDKLLLDTDSGSARELVYETGISGKSAEWLRTNGLIAEIIDLLLSNVPDGIDFLLTAHDYLNAMKDYEKLYSTATNTFGFFNVRDYLKFKALQEMTKSLEAIAEKQKKENGGGENDE